MRICREDLVRLHACDTQTDAFSSLFPDGADINPSAVFAAYQHGLDVDWLIYSLVKALAYRSRANQLDWARDNAYAVLHWHDHAPVGMRSALSALADRDSSTLNILHSAIGALQGVSP